MGCLITSDYGKERKWRLLGRKDKQKIGHNKQAEIKNHFVELISSSITRTSRLKL
jgi:hypothetical protein